MRHFFLALPLLIPLPALADTIESASKVAAVTLYPYGARVSRAVAFDAPAGSHTLIVPDLPQGTDPARLRVTAPEGVKVGAVSLAAGRQPATGDVTPPEVKAARAEIERLEQALRQGEEKVQLLRLKSEAADAQALFLRSIGKDGTPPTGSADDVKALAETIGSEILAARQTALQAGFEADAADRALKADREALDAARQALAALTAETETETLTLAVETAGGPATLTVETFTDEAGWAPVYDLRLTRQGTPELVVERGVLVNQSSGEDWLGVALTLSTARPAEQSAASNVAPWQMTIYEENAYPGAGGSYDRAASGAPPPMAEDAPVIVEGSGIGVDLAGTNVTYSYPAAVDLRSDVDALRLSLDSVTLAPEVIAAATPLYDDRAYVLAIATNTTPEVILPGDAQLWLEGQLVGTTSLPLVAAGDETEIGFGPIDGLQLTRVIPDSNTGDSGFISRTNEREEQVRIEVKNLTGESWKVRLTDHVPYSEQEDLVIRTSIKPEPDVENADDRRGVMVWNLEVAPGTTSVIQIATQIKWPSGYVLQ